LEERKNGGGRERKPPVSHRVKGIVGNPDAVEISNTAEKHQKGKKRRAEGGFENCAWALFPNLKQWQKIPCVGTFDGSSPFSRRCAIKMSG